MDLPELEKVKLYHALAYIEGDLSLLQQLLKQRLKSFEQIENNIKKAGREDISVQLDDILRDLNLQHLIDYIFDNTSALSFWNSSSDNIPFWWRSAYFCNF